jgi:hypothetical protein
MTSRTWGNRYNPRLAGSPSEGGDEAKRSVVELRSLAVGLCACIKGCPDFTKPKGRPSILPSVYQYLPDRRASSPGVSQPGLPFAASVIPTPPHPRTPFDLTLRRSISKAIRRRMQPRQSLTDATGATHNASRHSHKPPIFRTHRSSFCCIFLEIPPASPYRARRTFCRGTP